MLVVVVLLASALPGGCGGQTSNGQRGPAAKSPGAAPVTIGSGRIVPIGRGRALYLQCVGSRSPTVVLEAGFGGDTFQWQHVQPQLGRTTRTCAYDRAGLGRSIARPGVHDAR
jgi:pimeloyl-ACP methyl ester carboxylesterase